MTLTARVQNGRLVLDEPTTLPEGQVVQLVIIDNVMDATERAELAAAIEEAEQRHSCGARGGRGRGVGTAQGNRVNLRRALNEIERSKREWLTR